MHIWKNQHLDHIAGIVQRKEALAQKDPTVFFGSSTFRLWDSLAEDLGILDFLNAGIGGGTFETGLQHAELIFNGLIPQQIFVYFGENDITCDGLRAEDAFEGWQQLDAKLMALCPNSPVTYVGAKVGPARWLWKKDIMAFNALLKQGCEGNSQRTYWDVFSLSIGVNDKPLEKLFEQDGIHLNRDGYRVWAKEFHQ